MLVHIVNFGGVSVVGSKDVMAVSRAWGHSFASLRKLHSLRPISISSSTWLHSTFEPIVQQTSISPKQLRFVAHAAALEESPELHNKKRLSRAERYVLVENFVLRHKDAHEGKWPSLTTILKEIGGSRPIVKDILEELEKNAKVNREANSEAESLSAPSDSLVSFGDSQVEDKEELEDAHDVENEQHQEASREAAAPGASKDLETKKRDVDSSSKEPLVTTNHSASSRSGQSKAKSRESEADTNLWSSLREYESVADGTQEAPWNAPALGQAPAFDPYDTDSEDDSEESLFPGDYEESKDVDQQDGSELELNHTKSSNTRHSLEAMSGENYGLFIRFLPLAATEADLRAAFQDCGEIVRAQAMTPKGTGLKFTYGFVDFSTQDGLNKALRKDKVHIKGSTILTEACSGGPRRGELKPTSVRKPLPEHFKKVDSYNKHPDRNSDSRPPNGTRSSITNRFKRVDAYPGVENGIRALSNNGTYLVAVEGLPYPMPISAVEKMLSAHGDISRSELTREEGGTYSAHVEFKTEEARDSALASSRVYLGGRWCRISTGEPILTTVVRLSNVGNASESFILQRCGKIGRVENIVQRKEGIVDVHYHQSERRNMRKILDRLGEVNADFKRWHANLAPKCSLEERRNSAEIQDWVEVQKDKLLDNLTGAMKLMIIDLEDLRELVEAERSDPSNSGKSRNVERSKSSRS